jgi:endonuclease YncB( thermonuclease family)
MAGSPPPDPNLLKPLLDAGVMPTNGYRTPADIQRLRSQGYHPAERSLHLNGDAIDLTPGNSGMGLSGVQGRAQVIAGRWPGGKVLNEGDHVHLQLPGWGQAPGTPDTPNSGLPPLPQGYQLSQRGSLAGGNYRPTGTVHDGDTLALNGGGNARISGADAFELGQTGTTNGQSVPLGVKARNLFASGVTPSTSLQSTGNMSYGRPVVVARNGSIDLGLTSIGAGLALPTPQYLANDPARSAAYIDAQRGAIAGEEGAYAGTYQTPADYRHVGPDAPLHGKIMFTPLQARDYDALVRNPNTKPADLEGWATAQGHNIGNADNILSFMRRNPHAQLSSYFQQSDVLDQPVLPNGPALPTRVLGSLNEGIADTFGFPSDLLFGAINAVGLPTPEQPWLGSASIKSKMHDLGMGQASEGYAPRSGAERYGQAFARGVGQAVVPLGGSLAVGSKLRLAAPVLEASANPVRAALRQSFVAAAEHPGLAVAGEVGGGVGANVAGQVADDYAPGNRWAQVGAQVVGGLAGGLGGGLAAGRLGPRRVPIAPEPSTVNASEVPPPPPGYVIDEPAAAAMPSDPAPATVSGPVPRQPDVIDVSKLPPLPQGYKLDAPFGVTRKVGEPLSADEIAKLGEGVDPRSVLPRPANMIADAEEAAARPSPRQLIEAPDEHQELGVRRPNGGAYVRGPLDITQRLRTMGGVKDTYAAPGHPGDLARLGIDNSPRRMDFGSNEQFLGRLVNKESGMSMDDATLALWEEGYFPEFRDRPTTHDLMDRLHQESTGANRFFHPDDLEEVARFHSAQVDRGMIEQAADNGSPLVEDRGQHITLDDLEANRAPDSAYEDGPRIVGKLGNINLDRLENPQDVAQLIDQVQKRVGGFDAASRGRITHDETRKLADEMGLSPEDLLKRRGGQALNAEQLYATRALVQKSRELVAGLAKKAVGGSDEDVLSFRKAWIRHVALEEHVTGATAEAGRALQSFNMLAKSGDARGAAVRAYLKGAGGRESIEDAAQKIVDLMEDPAQANHFMAKALQPKWRDKLNELWINSLLSGPRTHVVNFVGNALTSIYSLPEQALTAGIGKTLGSADRSYLGEVGARVTGLANASVEGLARAKKAFVTGEAADDVTKVESRVHDAIGGRLGKIVRLPTRALTAADEFWKSINASAELHALAYRKAMREGVDVADRKARYEDLVKAPTGEMAKQAEDAARYYTFQRELGVAGQAVQRLANNVPGMKLVVPFVRTPANIIKFAGERSVLGLAMPEVRAALSAGGRARDEALAKLTLGSGLSTAAVLAAMHGRISGGGPSDPRERAALMQGGWQPYSVRVGDRWVSYQRFDPLSLLAGVAADFVEAGHSAKGAEADKLAVHLTLGIAKNLTSKTWLSGAADFFQMLDDPDRYGDRYFRNLAATAAVPSILNQTAQSIDPNLHDARTLMDAIKARTPGLSQSVPLRRDMWGEPITRGDAVGPDLVSPVKASRLTDDPLRAEVSRLRVPVSQLQRDVMVAGERVPLNAEQFDEYQRLAGTAASQALHDAIRSPQWQAMTDAQRSEFIRSAFSDVRKGARAQLMVDHPEIGGGASGEIPPLPPGYSVGAGQSRPVSRQGQQSAVPPASALPPLPPGFVLARNGGRVP